LACARDARPAPWPAAGLPLCALGSAHARTRPSHPTFKEVSCCSRLFVVPCRTGAGVTVHPEMARFRRFCFCTAQMENGQDGPIGPPQFWLHTAFSQYPGYSNGGNSWNAGNIIDVPLDRTAEALVALRASSFSGDKIGLYGGSRGAEHALLLASLMVRDGVAGLPDAIAVHSAPDVTRCAPTGILAAGRDRPHLDRHVPVAEGRHADHDPVANLETLHHVFADRSAATRR
jgi:hypothetical protein